MARRVEKKNNKIREYKDRSMNLSSRRMYLASGMIRGNLKLNAKIFREGARIAMEINSGAIYAQNSREFNRDRFDINRARIRYFGPWISTIHRSLSEHFNYHLRFQLKRATMGAAD